MSADNALFDTKRTELSTAVVSDVLDTRGHRKQLLPPSLGPMRGNIELVGCAMPMQEANSVSFSGVGKGSPAVGTLADKLQQCNQTLPGLHRSQTYQDLCYSFAR